MKIYQNVSLKPYNTFGVDTQATSLIRIYSDNELNNALKQYPNAFVLGGGSNILFTRNVDIPIIQLCFKGIRIISEEENFVLIEAKAGEVWHDFVMFCLNSGYGGVENLALIPGSVGATPIQNIGAYGVEIKDIFSHCEAINVYSLNKQIFYNKDCQFGYRNSIFKNSERGNYIITSVTFKLTKNQHHINDKYGDIKQFLTQQNITNPTPLDIANTVIKIRENKLPNPKILGNGGSFFKNPIIPLTTLLNLRKSISAIPFYETKREDQVKISAAWLIEQCQLKDFRIGSAGIYSKQPLVLVNYGQATGKEIWALAQHIQMSVFKKFGIYLEPEVNIF